MSKPFTGVKVVDFTRVLAGPYSSYQLALLGVTDRFLSETYQTPLKVYCG